MELVYISGELKEINSEDLKHSLFEFKNDYEATKWEVNDILSSDSRRKGKVYEKISEFLQRNFHFKTIRKEENSECYIYKEGIYVRHAYTFIDEIAHDMLDAAYSSNSTKNILDHIKAQTYINEEEFYCKDPELIPVQNGILNVRTRDLKKFSPIHYFFSKLPVTYQAIILNDEHLKFFESVIPNPEDRILLQEIFGYCLLRDYRFHKFFVFVGDGRNGKSVTLNLLTALLGRKNISGHSLYTLAENRFMVSELWKKLANINADLPEGVIKDTGIIKDLTGYDTISADRKFKDSITFRNHAKLIFSTNIMPRFNDKSDGWKKRWLMIEFNEKFMSKKDIEQLEEDLENVNEADANILDKLTSKDNLSSLLNFALDGLENLLEDNDFVSTKSNAEMWKQIERRSNPYAIFCLEVLEENAFGKVEKRSLREYFIKWCKFYKLPKRCDDKKLKDELYNLDFGIGEHQEHGSSRYWTGISVKPEFFKKMP